MREKIEGYILDIQEEINRCVRLIEENLVKLKNNKIDDYYLNSFEYVKIEAKIQTLLEVKNDLKNRLEEKL